VPGTKRCFLHMDRPCTEDCVAFLPTASSAGDDAACMLLVNLKRLADSARVLADQTKVKPSVPPIPSVGVR